MHGMHTYMHTRTHVHSSTHVGVHTYTYTQNLHYVLDEAGLFNTPQGKRLRSHFGLVTIRTVV